ncbi:MAG: branched-chain amino acid transport system II carrier protein [Bacteroidales bacterium]
MKLKTIEKVNTSSLVTGFSIFALFFGSGNLIFPPKLGIVTGENWLIGTIGFLISDIVLSLIALISILRGGGFLEKIIDTISPTTSKIIVTTIILFIGPIVAIPRILAVIYEVGIEPLIPESGNTLVSIVFLILTALVVLDPRNIVGIIGKYITPILLISLVGFIIVGLSNPTGTEVYPPQKAAFQYGIFEGYQTLDIMGAVIFAKIFTNNFRDNHVYDHHKQSIIILRSSGVAMLLMLIVYGGLAWLGALSQSHYNQSVDNVVLLKGIFHNSAGKFGYVILSVVVITACYTTVLGLVSTSAEYFHKLVKKKVNYKLWVIIVLVISFIISNLGVQKILNISLPLMELFYPIVIIIFLTHLWKRLFKERKVIQSMIITAFIFGIPPFLEYFNLVDLKWKELFRHIPLYKIELSWLIPCVIVGLITFLLTKKKVTPQSNLE